MLYFECTHQFFFSFKITSRQWFCIFPFYDLIKAVGTLILITNFVCFAYGHTFGLRSAFNE